MGFAAFRLYSRGAFRRVLYPRCARIRFEYADCLIDGLGAGPASSDLLVALTSGLAQIHLLPQGFRHTDWSTARILAFGMMAGSVRCLGLCRYRGGLAGHAARSFDHQILLMERLRLIKRLQTFRSPFAYPGGVLATTSGTVGKISGGGSLYFLVVYLKLVCATPEILRGTNVFLAGAFMLFRLTLLTFVGLFTPELLFGADFGTGGLSR